MGCLLSRYGGCPSSIVDFSYGTLKIKFAIIADYLALLMLLFFSFQRLYIHYSITAKKYLVYSALIGA